MGRRPSPVAVRVKLPSQGAPSAGKARDIRVAPAPTLEWVCRPAYRAHVLSRGGHRSGERVRQGGQGTQSQARALDGPGALLTTRWAACRRGFDSRWQPRAVHASKHMCGCPARNLLRRSALSIESVRQTAVAKDVCNATDTTKFCERLRQSGHLGIEFICPIIPSLLLHHYEACLGSRHYCENGSYVDH